MSRPLRPAFIKAVPSHRIRPYVNANAIPLNANETTSGSPSPWKEFATMPKQATESTPRLKASVLLRDVVMTCFFRSYIRGRYNMF